MKLETSSKSIELVIKTKKIVSISNNLKNKKFEEVFFKSLMECDLEALSIIIFILAEDGNFKNSSEVYDFLDEYKKESGKSYDEIYKDIAIAINEEGFFRTKMAEEELQARMNDILSSVNYEDIIKNSVEKMATEVVTDEFRGFKG